GGDEPRTGKDKTTLMLRLPHQVGALHKALEPFVKHGVYLTWSESFPTSESLKDGNPTYVFFIDVEGHTREKAVSGAIEALHRRVERVDVLGSFPRAETRERYTTPAQ